MKSRIALGLWIVMACVWVAGAQKPRTWSSTGGATVTASYAGFENGVVVLKQEDGKLLQIDVRMLVPDDQEAVRKLALAAGIFPIWAQASLHKPPPINCLLLQMASGKANIWFMRPIITGHLLRRMA